jgi:hypothetical protein
MIEDQKHFRSRCILNLNHIFETINKKNRKKEGTTIIASVEDMAALAQMKILTYVHVIARCFK